MHGRTHTICTGCETKVTYGDSYVTFFASANPLHVGLRERTGSYVYLVCMYKRVCVQYDGIRVKHTGSYVP